MHLLQLVLRQRFPTEFTLIGKGKQQKREVHVEGQASTSTSKKIKVQRREGITPLPNHIPVLPNVKEFKNLENLPIEITHPGLVKIFSCLEAGDVDRGVETIDVNQVLNNSGKLFVLSRVLEHMLASTSLTTYQIAILTSDPLTEKLLFKIFSEHFQYNCMRLSDIKLKESNRVYKNEYGF